MTFIRYLNQSSKGKKIIGYELIGYKENIFTLML